MSRPPEKVLIMPTSPTSPSSPHSPGSKKPARARSSLLSIISSDKKSVSDSRDVSEPLSPKQSTDSTTEEITSSGTSCKNLPLEITKPATRTDDRNSKKLPPPTLAKTFRTKSSPMTPEPPAITTEQPMVSPTAIIAENSKIQICEPNSDATEKSEINLDPDMKGVKLSSSQHSNAQFTTEVRDMTVRVPVDETVPQSAAAEVKSAVVTPLQHNSSDAAGLPSSPVTASFSRPECVEETLPPPPHDLDVMTSHQMVEVRPGVSDAIEPTTIEPTPSSIFGTDMSDDVDFPPPPPELDFPSGSDSHSTGVDNSEIPKSLDEISNQCDTRSVEMNNELYLDNEIKTDYTDPDKSILSTKDCTNDSIKIPSHDLNHTQIGSVTPADVHLVHSDNSIGVASDNTDSSMIVANIAMVAEDTKPSSSPDLIVDKQVNISASTATDQPEIEAIHSPTSDASDESQRETLAPQTSSDDSTMLTEEDESVLRLIAPPELPTTSSFSALDSTDSDTLHQVTHSGTESPQESATSTNITGELIDCYFIVMT